MVKNPEPYFLRVLSHRLIARALLGLVEILAIGGALVWLWTSEQGQHMWVWLAVGIPLFLAYVFIGGYVRHRLGLTKTSASARLPAENQSIR